MSANGDFFHGRRPQAVFKHGILRRYPRVFASKTGQHRDVVFLDGYAGRGEYEDGSSGSPKLLAEHAMETEAFRHVTGIFVERNPEDYSNLKNVLARYNRPNDMVLQGDVRDHLPSIIDATKGTALFAFLDPFGTALDRVQLMDTLMKRPGGPTEVLLHISVSTVARIGGLLRRRREEGSELSPTDLKTIAHGDRFLGGEWWQRHFEPVRSASDGQRATAAALRVASEYQAGICRDANFRAISMQIKAKPSQLPKYVLVLFTRHIDGLWYFADALGKAGREWHGAWQEHEIVEKRAKATKKMTTDVPALFDLAIPLPHVPKFNIDDYEKAHRGGWTATVESNIERKLTAHGPFIPGERVDWIYGDLLGAASERHARAAVKALHARGVITNTGVGPTFYREMLQPVA